MNVRTSSRYQSMLAESAGERPFYPHLHAPIARSAHPQKPQHPLQTGFFEVSSMEVRLPPFFSKLCLFWSICIRFLPPKLHINMSAEGDAFDALDAAERGMTGEEFGTQLLAPTCPNTCCTTLLPLPPPLYPNSRCGAAAAVGYINLCQRHVYNVTKKKLQRKEKCAFVMCDTGVLQQTAWLGPSAR